MALSNYTGLQAAVASWLNRSDLTASIPDFIALCEAQLRRELRSEVVRAAFVIDAPSQALPAGAHLRSVRLNTAIAPYNRPMTHTTPEGLADVAARHTATGVPTHYAVVAGELLVAPAPREAFDAEIIYYAPLVALAAVATNSVLTNAPDAYLYGALLEASAFLEHDERIPMWQARYDKAVASLNLQRERDELAAGVQPLRLPRVF